MIEKKKEEKLPNIYSSVNNSYYQSNQTIQRRNQIIDEYILNMDKKENGLNEFSLTSEEDDKDPFSSKAIKNLKPIKKEKNRLILPIFEKRKKLKSESTKKYKNFKENNNSNSDNSNINQIDKSEKEKHIRMSKNKNYSENNIYGNNNLCNIFNNKNNNLNSKWISSYNKDNNYLFNKNKEKLSNNSEGKIMKGRSKSHIGNKKSYNLYKDNNNHLNSNHKNNNQKYVSTQVEPLPKNNINIYLRNYKRNFTAKILNKKISILENNKQYKKPGKTRVYSTLNTRRIIENKHQIYKKLINEKDNPYGLGWINKMLGKNHEEKIGLTNGFINGVPVIKILGKGELSKREIKRRLSEIEKQKKEEQNKYKKVINADAKIKEGDLDYEYNIPKEILDQFNKNTKNFFKVRKDIVEEPEEEEGQTIVK